MKINFNSKIDLKTAEQILTSKGLNLGGKVQQYITSSLIDMFDDYVPKKTGYLKETAKKNNLPPYDTITYDTPYAARLYYNPQFNFNEAPKRGAFWDKRAWADNEGKFLSDLNYYYKN